MEMRIVPTGLLKPMEPLANFINEAAVLPAWFLLMPIFPCSRSHQKASEYCGSI
jgi:hypothetical protein